MVDVGRAEDRRALPGEEEERALVDRVGEADRLGDRDPPEREDDVAAPERPDARPGADPGAQDVGPGAGGVDHDRGPHLGRAASDEVADGDPGHPAGRSAQQSLGAGIGQDLRPVADRLENDPQGQARIIGSGVGVGEAAEQALAPEVRGKEEEVLGPVVAVRPPPGQEVVEGQAGPVGERAGAVSAIVRHQEAELLNQPGGLTDQSLTFADRLPGQSHLELPEVAQAAVDELGRAARGPPGDVVLLDQQRPQAEATGEPEDPRPGHAAAHDHDVPPFA